LPLPAFDFWADFGDLAGAGGLVGVFLATAADGLWCVVFFFAGVPLPFPLFGLGVAAPLFIFTANTEKTNKKQMHLFIRNK
jgi:hypothetical protein